MGRRNGCNGKVQYRSKTQAVAALIRLNDAGMNSYPCKICHGWHIGHSSKPWKVQARIDQLLRSTSGGG